MADATAFNLTDNQKAQRKLLVTCVNVGTAETPVWEIQGAGVEDSSIEYNTDLSTITDILGITEATINKLETTQAMEPMTVRGGNALQLKLYNQIKYGRLSELSLYQVMQIHAYVGTTGAYEAEVHDNCTIEVQSLGGSDYLDNPITIHFSNDKTHGTVNDYTGTITFTPVA